MLYVVKWEKRSIIRSILSAYVNYVDKRFGRSVDIVFDGYSSSTKDHCHQKRQPIRGLRVEFDKDTELLSSKELFLSNPDNKIKFISMLSAHMRECGYIVLNCEADADVRIVTLAVERFAADFNIVVVSDDTDVLVLLAH